MNIKIKLSDFEEPKYITPNIFKKWFPTNKYDNRYPSFFINKWIQSNSAYLDFLDISYGYDQESGLKVQTGSKIGLIPLKNPYGGKIYGNLTIKPRIGWIDIFNILDEINWLIEPEIIQEQDPIASDGVLPRWYRAAETLEIIERAISLKLRQNKLLEQYKQIPIGNINWDDYVSRQISRCNYNQFLTTQSSHTLNHPVHQQFLGIIKLIEKDILAFNIPSKIRLKISISITKIENILQYVDPAIPSVEILKKITVPAFYRNLYSEAIIKSIKYLEENKFSLMSSNNIGSPWSMKMDELFESWCAFHCIKFSKMLGARINTDIKNNAKIKFYNLSEWSGFKELRPDIVIEKDDTTLIIDTKYKKHLLYLNMGNPSKEIIEEHRRDFHQILAYLGASSSRNRIAVLLYPRIGANSSLKAAKMINYANTDMNTKIILADTNFDRQEFEDLFFNIWKTFN